MGITKRWLRNLNEFLTLEMLLVLVESTVVVDCAHMSWLYLGQSHIAFSLLLLPPCPSFTVAAVRTLRSKSQLSLVSDTNIIVLALWTSKDPDISPFSKLPPYIAFMIFFGLALCHVFFFFFFILLRLVCIILGLVMLIQLE